MTDPTTRIRERLMALMTENLGVHEVMLNRDKLADAIMREFALRPVAHGVVGEDGEVELYQWWENHFARVSGTKAGKVTAVINGMAIVEVDEIPTES
jgi:hypothetical protein